MRKDIEKAIELSMIYIPGEEREAHVRAVESFSAFVSMLDELDLSNVEPMQHPLDLFNVMRDDDIRKTSIVTASISVPRILP